MASLTSLICIMTSEDTSLVTIKKVLQSQLSVASLIKINVSEYALCPNGVGYDWHCANLAEIIILKGNIFHCNADTYLALKHPGVRHLGGRHTEAPRVVGLTVQGGKPWRENTGFSMIRVEIIQDKKICKKTFLIFRHLLLT